MGKILTPTPVKLFTGLLTSIPELVSEAHARLTAAFGPIDNASASFPFDSTRYYESEMGAPIARSFVSFERLIEPDALAGIKRETNLIEAEFASRTERVARPLNLDPGYLEQAKVVLASTKNFYHRILLEGGIYGEVTLHFERGEWKSFPWTFPDFRSGRYDDYFRSLRARYRQQLKERCQVRAPRDTQARLAAGEVNDAERH